MIPTTNIGPHRVTNGDILLGAVGDLMQGEKADVVYSDPPWGEGMIRYFRTINGQDGQPFSWRQFMAVYCKAIAEHAAGPVFVEMGNKWVGDLSESMHEAGVRELAMYSTFYSSPPRPLTLWFGWAGPGEPVAGASPAARRGYEAVLTALAPYARPGAVLLDPCCGLGMMARAALHYGMCFRGNELNTKRLDRTIAMLRKASK